MSAKKNLAVATLLALLAVPAFNGTNVSHTLHIPSVTAHADSTNESAWETLGSYLQQSPTYQQEHVSGFGPDPVGTATIDGHTFVDGTMGNSASVDGQMMSPAQALSELENLENGNNTMSNGSENGTNSSSSESNGNAQYTSQSGKLPQTNENNGASKAMALGASALVASAGLMALSFARKHKYLESVDLASNANTISTSNNKGTDNTPKYSNKSNYDMIMSNTFNDISKSLKNM